MINSTYAASAFSQKNLVQFGQPLFEIAHGRKVPRLAYFSARQKTTLLQIKQIRPGRLIDNVVAYLVRSDCVLVMRMAQSMTNQRTLPMIKGSHPSEF